MSCGNNIRLRDEHGDFVEYRLLHTRGDGNCLFEALSKCLYSEASKSFQIRADCVEHVLLHWDELQVQTEAPGRRNFESMDEYAETMMQEGTWGGHSEITAASRCYNVQIVIHEINNMPMVIGESRTGRLVRLMYTHQNGLSGHYQGLSFASETDEMEIVETDDDEGPHEGSLWDWFEDNEEIVGGARLVDDRPPRNVRDVIERANLEGDVECYVFYDNSWGKRVMSVKEPSSDVTMKPSLELKASNLPLTYMWAARYDEEADVIIDQVCLGPCIHECIDCSAMFWGAERRMKDLRTPATCCGSEVKVKITDTARFKVIDDDNVKDLFIGSSQRAEEFQKNIRAYNRILSVAFPVADYRAIGRGSNKSIVVNGAMSFQAHAFPDMRDHHMPYNHGQLYMVDMTEETLQQRIALSTVDGLNRNTLKDLEAYLRRRNPLIQQFMYAGEVQRLVEEQAIGGDEPPERVVLVVNPRRGGFRDTDRALFDTALMSGSRPQSNDYVAAVFIGPQPAYNYDMVFYPRDFPERYPRRNTFHVKVAATTLDTMAYPLIHLHGEDSWLQIVARSRLRRLRDDPAVDCVVNDSGTLLAYYAYRLQRRDDPRSVGVLLHSRKLFLQWLVDAAVKIIDHRLHFARSNQDVLQVCGYENLKNYVSDVAERHGKEPGRIYVMPSNEQRSERQLFVDYKDAVRISIEFGAPTLFLTFSTNPHWPAIQEELRAQGMSPNDYVYRPDIVVRVFLMMERSFMSDIVNKCVLGRVLAYVSVYEFQKTGLAHMHCAVILHPADRPHSAFEVDKILCAEIPPQHEDPVLHDLVMTLMIHRPCDGGLQNGECVNSCRKESTGKCRHGFPQPHRAATVFGRFGPELRRRRGPQYWHRGFRCFVDNRWVVPYNIRLLKRYRNHLNTLVCGPGLPFKYIYGYMDKMKGGDVAHATRYTFSLENSRPDFIDWDEISHFEAMRYIGPQEAVFRIYGQPFGARSHAVYPLPIHLPKQQIIYYRGHAQDANVTNNSKLVAWFRLNAERAAQECDTDSYPSAVENEARRSEPPLFYEDVCKYFRWEKGNWVKMKNATNCLGRIMHVNPSPRNMELFFLRYLVKNVPKPTSFEFLRIVDGIPYDTFREACEARGLEFRETCYEKAMEELASHAAPKQFRLSFAMILTNCEVSDISSLWLKFRESMSLDHMGRSELSVTRRVAFLATRRKILNMIISFGGNATEFASLLTVPSCDAVALGGEIGAVVDEDVIEDLDDNRVQDVCDATEVEDDLPRLLNADQQRVFDLVLESLTNTSRGTERLFTVTGPAGTGKTYLYTALIRECRRRGIPFMCCAYTAIAAGLLPEGKTCHLGFGIPTRGRMDGTDVTYLERCSDQGMIIQASTLVIIDEMSMLSVPQMEVIDKCLRMMDCSDTTMGTKTVLLGGDMRQILPIFKGFTPEMVIDKTLPFWSEWSQFRHLKLERNMRISDDPEYARWVLNVGDGSANMDSNSKAVVIPENVRLQCDSMDEQVITEALVTKVFEKQISGTSYQNYAILCPTNNSVNKVNDMVLDRFPAGTEERCFECSTEFIPEGRESSHRDDRDIHFDLSQDELDAMAPSNLPPQKLRLKKGCVVMLMKNLSQSLGLCNGTRLVVKSLYPHLVEVKRLDGSSSESLFLPRMRMQSDELAIGGTLVRRQFPLRVAHAMTINKSQGQTLARVGVLLRRPVFAHGQLYVAVSRVRRSSDITIAVVPGPNQGRFRGQRGGRHSANSTYTLNFVYKEVLV